MTKDEALQTLANAGLGSDIEHRLQHAISILEVDKLQLFEDEMKAMTKLELERKSNYLQTVVEHIYLVQISAIALNKQIEKLAGMAPISSSQIAKHDLSKFEKIEFEGYSNYFPDKRPEHKEAFLAAVQHHYKNNKHHPEYWQMRDQTAKTIAMPQIYMAEMWADWMGASFAYEGTWDMSEWLNDTFKPGGKYRNTFGGKMTVIANLAHISGYDFDLRSFFKSKTSNLFRANELLLKPELIKGGE